MVRKKHIAVIVIIATAIISSCGKLPNGVVAVQHLCPYSNPVYIIRQNNDSAMYWIPNCFAPGDSLSPNDSLVQYGRNLAQTVVTIMDSDSTVYVYNVHNFQYAGFDSSTVWYGNYGGYPAAEQCYLLHVSGTTLFGATFSFNGTVSLLRYFFGRDTVRNTVLVQCDSCFFNNQWSGTAFNPLLPDHEHFVPDAWHKCD